MKTHPQKNGKAPSTPAVLTFGEAFSCTDIISKLQVMGNIGAIWKTNCFNLLLGPFQIIHSGHMYAMSEILLSFTQLLFPIYRSPHMDLNVEWTKTKVRFKGNSVNLEIICLNVWCQKELFFLKKNNTFIELGCVKLIKYIVVLSIYQIILKKKVSPQNIYRVSTFAIAIPTTKKAI